MARSIRQNKFRWLILFVLVIFVLLLLVKESEESRRRSSGSKRTHSSGNKNKNRVLTKVKGKRQRKGTRLVGFKNFKKYGKYLLIGGGIAIIPAVIHKSQRSYSHDRRIPASPFSYVYYNSSEIEASYNVSYNDYWTPFLLALDDDFVFKCLIVPPNFTQETCPSAFASHVTNETFFYLPSEFNLTSSRPVRSKDDISLCCGSTRITSNLAALFALVVLLTLSAVLT